jgi:sugar/nucleoside kinase (ribokinase family)
MKQLDFLSIGDITTDAFIRIKEAAVSCDIDHRNCKISMNFADKVPYEFVEIVKAVGNSPNAAVGAGRLGLNSALVSNVGDDSNGKECLGTLVENGVRADYVKMHTGAKTNYHYVLWYENERTILVKHEAFEYSLPTQMEKPRWVYLSSLGESSLDFHALIAEYLKSNPDVKLAFQPGTYQKFGTGTLKEIYARTEVFVCNVEEAARITTLTTSEPKTLMTALHALGPKIVVVTDGPQGAYASDGKTMWFMPIYPDPKPPLERTGCGDAFASTFVSALSLGKNIEEALLWAPINPMSVVQYVGAQKGLLSREAIEKLLADAPIDYKPRVI